MGTRSRHGANVYDWYNEFSEFDRNILNLLHAHVQSAESEGVICVNFLPQGVTNNVQYCSNLLRNVVHRPIRKKWPGKLSKITILLHDSALPHVANLTKENGQEKKNRTVKCIR
jgi:hypothetical protein